MYLLDATSIATPTFTPATAEQVAGVLTIYQQVVNWIFSQLSLGVSFLLSNVFGLIGLAMVTTFAVIKVFIRMVHI